jgi:hypothetical protein
VDTHSHHARRDDVDIRSAGSQIELHAALPAVLPKTDG